ncbi:hypothetical protein VPH35_022801 [Triticum aestivum]
MEIYTDHRGSSGTLGPRWRDGEEVLDASLCRHALVREDLGASNTKQHKRASGLGGSTAPDGSASKGQTWTWRLVQPMIDEEAEMEAGNLARRRLVLAEEVEAEVGHGASRTWR